jgi:hypothetical protein
MALRWVVCSRLILACALGLLHCQPERGPAEERPVQRSEEEHLVLHLPDCTTDVDGCAGEVRRLDLTIFMPLRVLLDSMGVRLHRTYFAEYGGRPTDI